MGGWFSKKEKPVPTNAETKQNLQPVRPTQDAIRHLQFQGFKFEADNRTLEQNDRVIPHNEGIVYHSAIPNLGNLLRSRGGGIVSRRSTVARQSMEPQSLEE